MTQPSNPYGVNLYTVRTPSGSDLHLQTQEEAAWYDQIRDRYLKDNHFPNVSDLQDLDRLLLLEVLVYRWGLWMGQGFDYFGTRIEESQLRTYIKEYSAETRLLKASLGIDKATRDKDKGECHDAETQVLTLDGWRYFSDVCAGDLVATRSCQGYLEYQPALAVIDQEYDGELVVHETSRLNFAVTPNHRMLFEMNGRLKLERIDQLCAPSHNYRLVKTALVEPRPDGFVEFERDVDPYAIAPAAQWTTEQEEFLRSAWGDMDWPGLQGYLPRSRRSIAMKAWRLGLQRSSGWRMDKSLDLPKVERVEYARLLGFWLAEGTKRVPRGVQVHFSQSKPDGIAWMDALLQRMEWPHRRHVKSNGEVRWSISSARLRKSMEDCLGDGHELRIPQEVFSMWSEREMRGLLEGLVIGDGHLEDGRPVAYFTSSRALADDVQRLTAHLGLSGWVHKIYEAGSRSTSTANFPGWCVSIRHSRSAVLRVDALERRSYRGRVYCLTVPNGTLLTRRGGVVLWSGNSLADYTANLLERAKTFGYHRNEQYELAVTRFHELRSMVLTFDRCDEEERRMLDLSHETIFTWLREVAFADWDQLSDSFRKNQAIWVREL